MRPKTTGRPETDIWSQPASRDGELSTREPPPPQSSGSGGDSAARAAEVATEIATLIEPYQSVVTDKTLSKTVK